MPLKGNLSDFSLVDIIKLLSSTKKTGILRIEAGGDFSGESGEIRFKNGKIIYSVSNKGLIGENAVFHFFEYKEGDFTFEEKEPPSEINVKASTESLLMQGSRLITEWNKISSVIKSLSLVVNLAQSPPEGVSEIKLSKEEWKVLRMIDGNRTIKEIAEELKMPDFEVSKVIYGFLVSGLVEKVNEEVEGVAYVKVKLNVKIKPEFYLTEDNVYIDNSLIKEWISKNKIEKLEKILMQLPDGKEVIINVKGKDNLKGLILIPEEIAKEISLKERDEISVEPVKGE